MFPLDSHSEVIRDFQCGAATMPLISAYFTLSLYILSKLDTTGCYTYQTKPLFLSFSELAALERTSLDRTERPDSHVGDHTAKTFVVKCHGDSIEVVMKAYLFDPGWHVEAEDLRLGPAGAAEQHCAARVSGNREFIIRARLTDCGGKVTVGEVLHYQNIKSVFIA